jgi:hypothetical protein
MIHENDEILYSRYPTAKLKIRIIQSYYWPWVRHMVYVLWFQVWLICFDLSNLEYKAVSSICFNTEY